jgi:hypothetical protein
MQGILISIITVGVPDCCAADLRVYPSGTIWKGNKLEILIGILVSGKFEMHILPQVGHAVHEDSPNKVIQNPVGFYHVCKNLGFLGG